MVPGTRSDGLRLQLAASDVSSLRTDGTLAGVRILAAAARNGPGQGKLRASATGLAWQAPGSSSLGRAQAAAVDGAYLLEDGTDPSKWIRVQVYAAYLPKSGGAVVTLSDQFNTVGLGDVAVADALAGLVVTTQFTLENISPMMARDVGFWIDPSASGAAALTVSSDNVHYYAPDSPQHPDALTWSTIAAGASVNLWVRRTTPAASSSNPKITTALQFAWTGF